MNRELEAERVLDAVAQQLKRPSLPPHLPKDALDDLPESPGVYCFYGEYDALLYVGKSVNLRSRVLTYFAKGSNENPKNTSMKGTSLVRRSTKLNMANETREIA